MKYIMLAVVLALSGCSTPNPEPKATAAAYEQVKVGMTREQVYALLGAPKAVRPAGDIEHCRAATWSIPHGSHGWGRWKVKFAGDTVSGVSTSQAIVSGAHSHHEPSYQ